MAYSYTAFTGNGSTTQYAVAFAYIRREHVAVTVAGVPATFTWVNNSLIQMDAAPANGAAVRVYRTTPIDAPLVDFADGATFVAADLDTNSRQSIYIQQELDDAQQDNLPNVIPNGNKGDITTSVGGTVWAINTGAVAEAKIAAGAVVEAKIGTGAITETKLGTGAVTSTKILDGTILDVDVNASAGITAGKLSFTQAGTGATARTIDAKLKDVVSVKDFGAVGDGTTDDTAAIQAAIDALPGVFDVTANFSGNQYSGKPSPILFFPPGIYKITSRLLVEKNNVCIRGAGWNSSIIKYGGTAIIKEVIRFRNSFAGELSDIGLDGGLPYDPTLSETYGANAGLCCDLTPFFTSRNLWIANTRLSGLCAIHLWESYFDNLQVRNTGYFTNESTPVKGAGIYFCADASIKESSNALGAGFESQNTVFVKAKLVPVGAVVLCEAPTQNITLVQPITENRDFAATFPALTYSKYTITLANNFLIQGGYFYGHNHSFACNGTLFNIGSGLPGISIKDFTVFTSSAAGFPEVTKVFNVAGQHPVSFDNLSIDDPGAKLTAPFTILTGAGYPGTVIGDIHYSSTSTVFASTLIGANAAGYKGTLSSTNTTLQTVNKNIYDASARQYDTRTGTVQETFGCRAWCSFNGVTGTILASGNIASLTKNSAGNYTLTFTVPMPDANYAATVSANVLNNAIERPEIGGQAAGSINVANRAGAVYYDPSIFNVVVFR